jgi:muramoyltetrapeptide carboxypeptidase
MNRRHFTAALAALLAASASNSARAQSGASLLRAPRLKPGDTIALINPSGAVYEREPYAVAAESLQALGFKVREAPNLRAPH